MPAESTTYPKYLGERIRSARIDLHLTQEQLAEIVQLPRPAISNIESGNRAVDSMELVALSRALKKPLSFFVEAPHEESASEPLTVLYRSEEISDADRSAVDNFTSLSRDYAALEKLLDLKELQFFPSWGSDIKSKWKAVVHGERTASDLRAYLNIGISPALDLDKTLEQKGVKVVSRPLPGSKVWGFSVTSKEFGHSIFINNYCTAERQLFTLAHELGHLTMDRNHIATIFTEKQAPDSNENQHRVFLEVRANAFAAAFLMPDIAIRNALVKLGIHDRAKDQLSAATLDYLRQQFGVSSEAMLWRLVNLKIISKQERTKLSQLPATENIPTAQPPQATLPHRYQALALEAFRRAKISIGKLADFLRLDLYETRKLVKQFGIQQSPA